MPVDETSNTILYVSDKPESHGVKALFESHGYVVQARNTFVSGLQYLMVQQPELLIVDNGIEKDRGLEFCHTVRTDSSFHNVPILLLSKDGQGSPNEIKAFEYGVDDFIRLPIVHQVCIARALRLMKKDVTDALGASLSVQIDAKELPGILQYLETELKTGKLNVVLKDHAAVICINEGRLAKATCQGDEGPDVITEILCWPRSQVTFQEHPLDPEDIVSDYPIMSIVMNSVVEVDEYNDVKTQLPSDDATFHSGKVIDEAMPDSQKKIYYAALQGYAVQELIHDIDASERRSTMWLIQLIEEGFLKVAPPAFEGYKAQCLSFFPNSHLDRRLVGLRQPWAEIEFPLRPAVGLSGVGAADWLSPVPNILLVGDTPDHVKLFTDTLGMLYANITRKKLPSRRVTRTAESFRIDFGNKSAINLVALPSILTQAFEADLSETAEDVFAILHFASAQDLDTCRVARRIHKVLRRQYPGVYYHVVPRVPNSDGKHMFKVNCIHCGFKLAVDMEEAGFSGECPVCSKTISIPDSMDNLSKVFHLPEDVPVVTIEPGDAGQVRDLLLLVIDTVLNYCSTPDEGGSTDLHTEVRGRIGGYGETQIEVADTQYMGLTVEQIQELTEAEERVQLGQPAQQPAKQRVQLEAPAPLQNTPPEDPEAEEEVVDLAAAGFAAIPQEAVGEESEGGDDNREIDEILTMLNNQEEVSPADVTITEILDMQPGDGSDDDEDDIEDFINSIKSR